MESDITFQLRYHVFLRITDLYQTTDFISSKAYISLLPHFNISAMEVCVSCLIVDQDLIVSMFFFLSDM